jgi:hypothetical protein
MGRSTVSSTKTAFRTPVPPATTNRGCVWLATPILLQSRRPGSHVSPTLDVRCAVLRSRSNLISIPDRRDRQMVEGKVREKDSNLHTWFATIPMTDDVYLGLQAQNMRALR